MIKSDTDQLDLDPLLRDALAWVIRLHSGAATSDDRDAVMQWRGTSAEHEAAFRDAVKLWRAFGDAARTPAHLRDTAPPRAPLRAVTRMLMSRRRWICAGGVAAVGSYFAMSPPLGLWPSLRELAADYRTVKGEQRDLILTSGVAVKLNTETSITVRAPDSDPQIELISGEAAFDAKRPAGRPLVVIAATARLTAVRADFNARCLDGIVSVSCLDGAVDIAVKGRAMRLDPGLRVSFSDSEGLGSPVAADAATTTAWQGGLLIVQDQPLDGVVREINRYRYGKIIILDNHLAKRMVTGTFHLNRLDEVIGQVRALFGATIRSLPGGVVLMS